MSKKVSSNVKNVRPIYDIANEIISDWGKKVYFGAKPYLAAMRCLESVDDNYMLDSARNIIMYFLANAGT